MTIRKVLFWMHLAAGCTGGLVILTMSITGVVLMYERQILARVERGPFRSEANGAARLPVEELLARVGQQRGGLAPNSTLTMRADPREPAELGAGREGVVYINPYTGQVMGQANSKWRSVFQKVTAWHRWLGAEGPGRATFKAITGACNLAFLLLIVTGPFLWLPKRWTRQHLAPIAWFRGGLSGKARDFNWHNVLGVWSAVPLFLVVLTAVPMSYTWGTNLIYRMTGTEPPVAAGGPGRGGRGEGGPGGPGRGGRAEGGPGGPGRAAENTALAGLNLLWTRAEAQRPGWKSIALRIPAGRGPAVFTIDTGDGGQPQKRATLTIDRAAGSTARWEPFAGIPAGRRLRSWSRFVHTGEAYGLVGQTVAGIGSACGVVLVWTGIALSLRRLAAWRRRRRVGEREREPVGSAAD